MARRFWQHASPLNEQIVVGSASRPPFSAEPLEIVGIVADVRDPATGREPAPTVYVPSAQVTDAMTAWSSRLSPLTWVVRTGVEPHLVASMVETELRGAAGGVPIARMRTMKEVLATATARTDFTAMLITIFAAIALVLSATGMYALMSYSVQQRTQEIGIRIAFGASPIAVRNGVVLDGIRLALAGIALGVIASLWLARVMVTLIVGITAWDPTVFLSVAALLTAAALAAAYLPARRATRVSPLDALRGAA
jgi:predicted lysophospholipase L1 biosynthesis ABC-type transport system permease subunit